MTWMVTASGTEVNLAYITGHEISVGDIAAQLSRIRRFTGAPKRSISVAEHSLRVCDVVERHHGCTSPSGLLAALMHDAHEYLTGDLSSPMKQLIGEAWDVVELDVQQRVLQHFGLLTAYRTHQHLIKPADLMVLTAEKQQCMPESFRTWPCEIFHPAPDWLIYGPEMPDSHWEAEFLARYQDLANKLTEQHAQLSA
jgi:uncharacterized protein